MAGRLAIRRLRLDALAPRDHPAPGELSTRLADALRVHLAPALADAVAGLGDGAEVLRIRRLRLDLTVGGALDPEAFAALVARQIAAALRLAALTGAEGAACEGVMAYPTRAAHLAALVEALAAGQAGDSWWLRETEGLRFLAPASAVRTALLADPALGVEALASLPPARLAQVLAALSPIEAERVLEALAGQQPATIDLRVWAAALSASPLWAEGGGRPPSPLAVYLQLRAQQPALAGPQAAAAARLFSRLAEQAQAATPAAAAAWIAAVLAGEADPHAAATPGLSAIEQAMVAQALARRVQVQAAAPGPAPDWVLSRFGGLLLLLPCLDWDGLEAAFIGSPEDAALVAYAALGLCAGRARFPAWLSEPLWRPLFGLDPRPAAVDIAERLAAIDDAAWDSLTPLASPLDARDARFLLPPRVWAGSRAAAHTLAGLARATQLRFARRLIGFDAASAAFLWENLLGAGAVVERRAPGAWTARLSRPPLDVLLSLSRLADETVRTPSGVSVRLGRVSP